jgi:hypothetical protein
LDLLAGGQILGGNKIGRVHVQIVLIVGVLMMLRKCFLLPLLAACGAAVEITVASSGGNATSGIQYGIMEEVGPSPEENGSYGV